MFKKTTIFSLLCIGFTSPLMIAADKRYWEYDHQRPNGLSEELNKVSKYVKGGNVEAISQLQLKMQEWENKGCPFPYAYVKIKDCIRNDYENFITKKNEPAVKIMLPLAIEQLGYSPLFMLALGINRENGDYEKTMKMRWLMDVVSRTPDALIKELKTSGPWEIKKAWPFIPVVTQKRIIAEAQKYYEATYTSTAENRSSEAGEGEDFLKLLNAMNKAAKKFELLYTIISQDIKEQEAAKQADLSSAATSKLAADSNHNVVFA